MHHNFRCSSQSSKFSIGVCVCVAVRLADSIDKHIHACAPTHQPSTRTLYTHTHTHTHTHTRTVPTLIPTHPTPLCLSILYLIPTYLSTCTSVFYAEHCEQNDKYKTDSNIVCFAVMMYAGFAIGCHNTPFLSV